MIFPYELKETNLRFGNLPKRRLDDFRIRQVLPKGIRALRRIFTFLEFCEAIRGLRERDIAYGHPRFSPGKACLLWPSGSQSLDLLGKVLPLPQEKANLGFHLPHSALENLSQIRPREYHKYKFSKTSREGTNQRRFQTFWTFVTFPSQMDLRESCRLGSPRFLIG
jgi:hypothetical protein